MKLHDLIQKLSKPHWGSMAPSDYVISTPTGKKVGLGVIAARNIAAFNLTWLAYRDTLFTLEGQKQAVNLFAELESVLTEVVDGADLGSYATLYTPTEFGMWYALNQTKVSITTQGVLNRILMPHDTRNSDDTQPAGL